ncbi:MAG: Fic family protein [Clostridia bacterium]|nr:Fic family protein [Clostridia bacterium]
MADFDEKNTPIKDPFEEYEKASAPGAQERAYIWRTAIGLQLVDGLTTSDYLRATAARNISGEITVGEAAALIEDYYRTDRKQEAPRTEEADKVTSRISEILSEKGFTLSPAQYLSIHKRLFTGIYSHAGEIRTYNITKKEWVLDGDTVTYGGWTELRATLEYDIATEKAFDYSGLSMYKAIKHIAMFISRLWQIHVFGEGNTRTTAVFLILYLRSLGFDATNDIFEKNAWYFRNAMVRANYNNFAKGVHETTEYVELFLRNLLMSEDNPLRNRALHISWKLVSADAEPQKQYIEGTKQYIDDEKRDIELQKQYIDAIISMGLSRKSASNAIKLYSVFGIERFFGRSEAAEVLGITAAPASTLLKKLTESGILLPVSGMGKGKYRFSPDFFKCGTK